MKEIWLVSRELGGWAEAGGVKDVVKDQARAFTQIGWKVHVVLPLYGFLKERVEQRGTLSWSGASRHLHTDVAVWEIAEQSTLHFVSSPSFTSKNSLYTYTAADEESNPLHVRGQGYSDGFAMNLQFQWALASYWFDRKIQPGSVLCHDGHAGFLPAICRTGFGAWFQGTAFAVLIHNAGSGYRQEMEATALNEQLLGLPPKEARASVLDRHFEPLVSASRHGKLATVSQNYAQELLTGRNDHWSGPFGRWLRTSGTALTGITNGISTEDKDPRDPEASGIPAAFNPLKGDWAGKQLCRTVLRETLLLKPAQTYGRLVKWDGPLYVMQGRLTAQKGVEALLELIAKALKDSPRASILIMAQGERRYEERLTHLAREEVETGRFLFVNKFEEALARLVFAAGDFFLMPSEYEPCGLTDLKAQLMGTLPIVHRVGGLVKVLDGKTGYSYEKHSSGGFWGAYLRSYRDWEAGSSKLDGMRRAAFLAVLEDFQWTRILEDRYVPWLTDSAPFPILTAPLPT